MESARAPIYTSEYFDGLSTHVCTKQCGRPLSGHLHEICTRFDTDLYGSVTTADLR